MNFGKLLAVGKSIASGRAEFAYRADRQFYLPKFGPKNPFNKAPAGTSASGRKDTPPTTLLPQAAGAEQVSASGRIPAPAPGSRPGADISNAKVKFSGPGLGVQSELSLDRVKVVNNDLTDAEVEVVPLKSRPAALPPPRKSWEILGERLLKTTAL
jgi:hypothetical protein